MAFRKRFRTFRRRRRLRPETYTVTQCRRCHNVYNDMPCVAPLIDVMELMTMRTPRSTVDTTEVSNPSDKAVVVDAIRFQSQFLHDPSETQGFPSCDPSPFSLVFWLSIWEAIMLLPLGQGSTVAPSYLPILTEGVFQTGDVADRVLWKRITHLPIFGSAVFINPQLTSNYWPSNVEDIHVKSKVRIDDRHGLYYVRNYTHDIAQLGLSNDFDSCTPDSANNPCVIPVQNDAWFKIFYHTRH